MLSILLHFLGIFSLACNISITECKSQQLWLRIEFQRHKSNIPRDSHRNFLSDFEFYANEMKITLSAPINKSVINNDLLFLLFTSLYHRAPLKKNDKFHDLYSETL